MQYEWDEKKRNKNLTARNIDFAVASGFIWDKALTMEDNRSNYNEPRSFFTLPLLTGFMRWSGHSAEMSAALSVYAKPTKERY